ncbi:hypothetical protein BXT84_00560 [Sulfobacillus thermotolerans]|uniref:Relaxase n=1 Tax=Sulfobacillus thermotolerans TaxID=338644 RepID=A0ABM6RMQ6_9FIRM|nr:hypothetical protein BXT84_00560 [Sulfobacillus thermotolerans]
MPQKPFVMRVHFYLPEGTGRQSLRSGAHHVEYMGSKEKGELLIDGLMSEEVNDRSLRSAAIHAKYAGEREGSLGYLGSMSSNPKRAQESILNAQGPVWRVIASVGEADVVAMGGALLTKAGWEKAAAPTVEKMVATLGLDPAKTQWIAAVHRHQHHEQNPHIHLLVWEEGPPTRKTAQWSRDELRIIKRDWVSSLYAPERQQLGQIKTAARTQARQQVIDLMTYRNRQQGFEQEFTQRLAAIGVGLPGQGRLAYAYMPPATKAQVADTIRWLWSQDPGLRKAHDDYLKAAERMGTFYWHQDESKTQNTPGRQQALERIRARAEHDLIQRLAAPVLKAARQQQQQTDNRPASSVHLPAVLTHLIRGDIAQGRASAYALEEVQWRRKQAELAIARNTGQHIVL